MKPSEHNWFVTPPRGPWPLKESPSSTTPPPHPLARLGRRLRLCIPHAAQTQTLVCRCQDLDFGFKRNRCQDNTWDAALIPRHRMVALFFFSLSKTRDLSVWYLKKSKNILQIRLMCHASQTCVTSAAESWKEQSCSFQLSPPPHITTTAAATDRCVSVCLLLVLSAQMTRPVRLHCY